MTPAVEGALDFVGFGPHDERADDRGDDRDGADHQRVDRDLAGEVAAAPVKVRTPSSITATEVTA